MKSEKEIDSKRVASSSPRPCSALLRDWLDTIHVLAQEMQEQWWMSPHYRLQCASAIEEVAQCCMDYIDSTNPPKSEKETIQVGGNVKEALTLATKRAKAKEHDHVMIEDLEHGVSTILAGRDHPYRPDMNISPDDKQNAELSGGDRERGNNSPENTL